MNVYTIYYKLCPSYDYEFEQPMVICSDWFLSSLILTDYL